MDEKQSKELIENEEEYEGNEETLKRTLTFRKRKEELKQRYLEGDELFDMKRYINKHIYLYRNFEPTFEVEPGEIYYADFPVGFGSEIHGRHPVVVLNKSGVKYPIMTVIPLTSKSCNKVSDFDLGVIEGLSKNNEHSIAVINQTRSIDKRRIVVEEVIDSLMARERKNPCEPGEEIRIETLKICRLPKEKLDHLRNKVKRFIGYNKISSKRI